MYAAPVQDLIDELGRLPGVGPKSAQRIAFHLLKLSDEDLASYDLDDLADAGPAVVSPEQRLLEAFPGAEEVTP